MVDQALAESRATVCAGCPKNGKGDLTSWFTVPAAKLIQVQLEAKNKRKLETKSDEALGVCEACSCPLKLKVFCPLDIINSKMSPTVRTELHPGCWILSESQ